MKVAIVGAGVCGLMSIKSCLEEGLEPVCFEASPDIGGLWNFHDVPDEARACVMRSTVCNISKELMCFSDFPFPDDFPNYCRHSKVQEYFRLYAAKFNLLPHVRFEHDVLSIRKRPDFTSSGQWTVVVRDRNKDKEVQEIFDAVMVCTGHDSKKNIPDIPGKELYKGKIIHSHDYRSLEGFQNKTVVVVGIGNSGGDLITDLGKVAKQVYLSTRRGFWLVSRLGKQGMPLDLEAQRRVTVLIKKTLGANVLNWIVEKTIKSKFNHELFGIKPRHRFLAQPVLVNDELPSHFLSGLVITKPDISRFTEDGVEFKDGSTVKADVVAFATGYNFDFPFLEPEVVKVENNEVDLYKYVFPPNLSPTTLAVIGLLRASGSIITIAELQARWACLLFKQKVNLPCKEIMLNDINEKKTALRKLCLECTDRETIRVDWMPFMDETAEQFGAKPDFVQLLWKDPLLAFSCFFGPCTPYQYRLFGPGKWTGAREAILTQQERIYKGFHPTTKPPAKNTFLQSFIFLFLIFVFILKCLMFS